MTRLRLAVLCTLAGLITSSSDFRCLHGLVVTEAGVRVCQCDERYAGDDCGRLQCNGNGDEDEETRECHCDADFKGSDCGIIVCHNGGVPNATKQECICDSMYKGRHCKVCIENGLSKCKPNTDNKMHVVLATVLFILVVLFGLLMWARLWKSKSILPKGVQAQPQLGESQPEQPTLSTDSSSVEQIARRVENVIIGSEPHEKFRRDVTVDRSTSGLGTSLLGSNTSQN